MRKNLKGFTLVELIVVIAIIAVLAGVVLVVINPAALLAKGRDAKRLEDLDALHKAISLAIADAEISLVDTAGACATCTSLTAVTAAWVDGTSGWVKFTPSTQPGKVGLSKYLPTLPVDPTNATVNLVEYVYTFGSTVTTYEINAVLESTDNTLKMSTDGGNAPAVYEVGTSLTVL